MCNRWHNILLAIPCPYALINTLIGVGLHGSKDSPEFADFAFNISSIYSRVCCFDRWRTLCCQPYDNRSHSSIDAAVYMPVPLNSTSILEMPLSAESLTSSKATGCDKRFPCVSVYTRPAFNCSQLPITGTMQSRLGDRSVTHVVFETCSQKQYVNHVLSDGKPARNPHVLIPLFTCLHRQFFPMPSRVVPVELYPIIISILVTPSHPLQVGHTVDTINALRELCLVNHFMCHLSTPHLYSSITIYTHDQHQALLRTYSSRIMLCSFIESLAVHSFPDYIEEIHSLFYLLGPYLRRLSLLGITAIDLGSSVLVRDALREHCTNLEHFVLLENNPESLFDQAPFSPPYSFWPEFKDLYRLVLDDAVIDHTFVKAISELPCLSHLALIDPKWGRGKPPSLLDACQSLQRVVVILREIGEWYAISLMKLGGSLSPPRDGLDIRLIKLGWDDVYSKGRIQEWVCSGILWELEGNFAVFGNSTAI